MRREGGREKGREGRRKGNRKRGKRKGGREGGREEISISSTHLLFSHYRRTTLANCTGTSHVGACPPLSLPPSPPPSTRSLSGIHLSFLPFLLPSPPPSFLLLGMAGAPPSFLLPFLLFLLLLLLALRPFLTLLPSRRCYCCCSCPAAPLLPPGTLPSSPPSLPPSLPPFLPSLPTFRRAAASAIALVPQRPFLSPGT